MKRLPCILLLCATAQLCAAPASSLAPAPTEKKESGPMEIDFTPLGKVTIPNY
jgi:hypothetical protein